MDAVNRTYPGPPSVALGGPWLAVARTLESAHDAPTGIRLAFYGRANLPGTRGRTVPAYVVATGHELILMLTTGVARDQPFQPETFTVRRIPFLAVSGFAVHRGFVRDRVTITWLDEAAALPMKATIRDVGYRPELTGLAALIEDRRAREA